MTVAPTLTEGWTDCASCRGDGCVDCDHHGGRWLPIPPTTLTPEQAAALGATFAGTMSDAHIDRMLSVPRRAREEARAALRG